MAIKWARSALNFVGQANKSKIFLQSQMRYASGSVFTIKDVIADLMRIVGAQKYFRPQEFDRSNLESILPKSQDELPPQKMSRSLGEAFIPLGSDEALRQEYLNPVGVVRFGRLLENLDVFAVWICYKHVFNPKQKEGDQSPFCIVTALVDHIKLADLNLRPDRNIKLRGCVSWVGRSSLETHIELHQVDENDKWHEGGVAKFVMVARDPLNRGSAVVNRVIPETEREKKLFSIGESNKLRRKKFVGESLLKYPPTESERELIHNIYMSTLDPQDESYRSEVLPEGCQWMEKAELKTTMLCHPQERNRFNKIFGGYIMRGAFELSWANCYSYSKLVPSVTNVDDIWFRKPIEIGSVVFFTSRVVYVEANYIQVRVIADVLEPETGNRFTTNLFHFTFSVTPQGDTEVPVIIPHTYSDAMLYLDGKRHFEVAFKDATYAKTE